MRALFLKFFAKDMVLVYQLLDAQHKIIQTMLDRQEDLEQRLRMLELKNGEAVNFTIKAKDAKQFKGE